MTTEVITLLRCNGCIDELIEKSGNTVMKSWVRMVAREQGWITKKVSGRMKDYCPTCASQKEARVHLPVEAKSLPHTDPRVEWDDDNLINNDGEFA